MNSLARNFTTGTVRAMSTSAPAITDQRKRRAKRQTGSYRRPRRRLTGLWSSSRIFPRMKVVAMAGTSVIESNAANAIEKVLVQASGEKRRPSVPSSVNTGRNPTVMTSSEKKIGRPTS